MQVPLDLEPNGQIFMTFIQGIVSKVVTNARYTWDSTNGRHSIQVKYDNPTPEHTRQILAGVAEAKEKKLDPSCQSLNGRVYRIYGGCEVSNSEGKTIVFGIQHMTILHRSTPLR